MRREKWTDLCPEEGWWRREGWRIWDQKSGKRRDLGPEELHMWRMNRGGWTDSAEGFHLWRKEGWIEFGSRTVEQERGMGGFGYMRGIIVET